MFLQLDATGACVRTRKLRGLSSNSGQAQKAPPLLLPCSEDCSLGSGPSCCAPRSLVVVSSLGHCSKVATVSCC